jgi:hypothetical protein
MPPPILLCRGNVFIEPLPNIDIPTYCPLIRYGPHRKRRVQQFFYCCVYSLLRNVFAEPLPSNGVEIQLQTHILMGETYEIRRWGGLRCHDLHTKFYKDWFRHSEVDGGYTWRHRHTQTQRWSHKSSLIFSTKPNRNFHKYVFVFHHELHIYLLAFFPDT